jgi:hypothetical protein
MEFPNKDTILETACESLNSISVLTHQPFHFNSNIPNTTVANFKKHSSLLNIIGHARFRRAVVVPLPQPPQTLFPSTTMPPPQLDIQPQRQDLTKPSILRSNPKFLSLDLAFPKETYSVSSTHPSCHPPSPVTASFPISNKVHIFSYRRSPVK